MFLYYFTNFILKGNQSRGVPRALGTRGGCPPSPPVGTPLNLSMLLQVRESIPGSSMLLGHHSFHQKLLTQAFLYFLFGIFFKTKTSRRHFTPRRKISRDDGGCGGNSVIGRGRSIFCSRYFIIAPPPCQPHPVPLPPPWYRDLSGHLGFFQLDTMNPFVFLFPF